MIPCKKFNNKLISLPIVLSLLLTLFMTSGCNKQNFNPISKTAFFFDTVITISIYDEISDDRANEIFEECIDKCKYYENLFSKSIPTSDISRINNAQNNSLPNDINSETIDLIKFGLDFSRLSQGALEITLSPVIDLWDFRLGNNLIPSDDDITSKLASCGYEKLNLSNNIIFEINNKGINIDLGAIAKGYIADRIKEILINKNIKSALIDLGGNVLCVGKKPDLTPFNIGIKKPFSNNNEILKILEINDCSVVTSGIYERYFTYENKLYHHILDPKTGYPVDNNLLSVTIVTKESLLADALSTACFVLGIDEGIKLANSFDDVLVYFVDSDYNIHTN